MLEYEFGISAPIIRPSRIQVNNEQMNNNMLRYFFNLKFNVNLTLFNLEVVIKHASLKNKRVKLE